MPTGLRENTSKPNSTSRPSFDSAHLDLFSLSSFQDTHNRSCQVSSSAHAKLDTHNPSIPGAYSTLYTLILARLHAALRPEPITSLTQSHVSAERAKPNVLRCVGWYWLGRQTAHNPFGLVCILPQPTACSSGAGVAAPSRYVSPSVERAVRAPRRVRGSVMRTAIPPLAACVSSHDRRRHVFSPHSPTYDIPHIHSPTC